MSKETDKMNALQKDHDTEINPFNEITTMLQVSNIQYQTLEHQPVYTSTQAEDISGLALNQGAKALLLKTDKTFVLVVLPGDRRVDFSKLKQVLPAKKVRFAEEKEVKTVMHCNLAHATQ